MKKIITVLLLFAVLFGIVSCTAPKTDKKHEDNKKPVTTASKYDDIIKKYTKLLTEKKNGKELTVPKDTADDIDKALYEIASNCTDPSVMGYATKDLNSDGTEELVLLDKSNKLYALFTVKDNTSVLLLSMYDMRAHISSDGTVYANKFVPDKEDYTYIKKIVNGTLEGLEYGSVIDGDNYSCYKIENGVRTEITFNEKKQLDNSITGLMMQALYHNKTTGFRFVPAIRDESAENNAPVPDFSSYDGILSAYKIIVDSFSEYTKLDWSNGKFDSLFNISDNDTYDIFHQIYYGGINMRRKETYFGQDYAADGKNAYGYAKKDINGDGTEELILLNDHYEILAIFTQKLGKAVFLDGTRGVWIDGNGLLHKDVFTGGLVDRDGECFVYEIEGAKLKSVIGVGYKVNIYLQKEGWYKIYGNTKTEISAQEGEALYAECDILPSGYCDNEYTRSFSGIEFTPLFESTLASQKHIDTFSNIWFVNGNTLTVSSVSNNDVTMNIKFVHTVGEYDFETNTEPEVYITNLETKAVRNKNRYEFEKDGITGYIEFAVNSAWVIVTESENEHVTCRSYLFDYPED